MVSLQGKNTDKMLEWYNKNKGIILSPSKLKLDGHTIVDIYKLSPIGINNLKNLLFELVTEDKIKNEKDDLILYTNCLNLLELDK